MINERDSSITKKMPRMTAVFSMEQLRSGEIVNVSQEDG